jgi:7-cyano-7-deazaguanine synthase
MSGIDEKGSIPLRGPACVLLSGGMDSTACLHWALSKHKEVRALGFDYGQPHRDAELTVAGALARKHSVPFEIVVLADTMHAGLLAGVPKHALPAQAIHRAFVPGRNLIFLSIALGRICQWWPLVEELDIVIGACAEDAAGFPDCSQDFLKAAQKALSAAVARQIHVASPYSKMTKGQMLHDVGLRFPSGIEDIQASWSCYAGKGPCGECTACVLRSRALSAAGLEDWSAVPAMHGGDTHRDHLLKGAD